MSDYLDQLLASESQPAGESADVLDQLVSSEKAARDQKIADHDKRAAAYEAEHPPKVYNPTDGMSTFQKVAAGIGSGMTNIVQGAGNMLHLVDDKTIMDRKHRDSALGDTTAGSIGQFIGETAALAPLGVVGKGAQATSGLLKTRAMLPTAAKVLGGRAAPMVAEGGLAGAVAANPNERGRGAALGATTAGALKLATSAVGRTFNRGLSKTSSSSKDLIDLVQKKTGRRPFIPLLQAADVHSGPITAKTGAFMDFVSLLPSAKRKMENQARDFGSDVYEANLRQAFGGNKADVAVKVLRETGDMQKAIEAGKNAGKSAVKSFTETQQILNQAAKGIPRGRYTPRHLLRASEKSAAGDVSYAPMRDTALKMEDVINRSVGTSNVASRDAYHTVGNLLGRVVDAIPTLGSVLASKTLQNTLMGNTGLQRALQAALDTKSADAITRVVRHIERAASAQPAISDESNDFQTYQEKLQSYEKQAVDALRGMM